MCNIYEWYKMELCDLLDKKRLTKKRICQNEKYIHGIDNYRIKENIDYERI